MGFNGFGYDANEYILALVGGVSGCMRLEPAAAVTADNLLRRCTAMGAPKVCLSGTALHFKNLALQLVSETLDTTHHFAVENSPWINGTVECMIREIVRILKVLLNEGRPPLVD